MRQTGRFTRGAVVRNLECSEKFGAIHELLRKAQVFRSINELDEVEQAIVAREKVQSTGLGSGVAVAHGKTSAVGNIVMALGISERGIEFGAFDDEPVRLLFIVANPPGMQLEYLLALSVIVRTIRDRRFRDELFSYKSAERIEKRLMNAMSQAMVKRGFPFT